MLLDDQIDLANTPFDKYIIANGCPKFRHYIRRLRVKHSGHSQRKRDRNDQSPSDLDEDQSDGSDEYKMDDESEQEEQERLSLSRSSLPGFTKFQTSLVQHIIDPSTPSEEVHAIIDMLRKKNLISNVKFAKSISESKPDLERDIFQQLNFDKNGTLDKLAHQAISSKESGTKMLDARCHARAQDTLQQKLELKPIKDFNDEDINEICPPQVTIIFSARHLL